MSRHAEVKWAEREDKVFLPVLLPRTPRLNLNLKEFHLLCCFTNLATRYVSIGNLLFLISQTNLEDLLLDQSDFISGCYFFLVQPQVYSILFSLEKVEGTEQAQPPVPWICCPIQLRSLNQCRNQQLPLSIWVRSVIFRTADIISDFALCMAFAVSLSLSLRIILPSSRTSHAPVISHRAAPRVPSHSIKSIRTNLKSPISASALTSTSSTSGMAGQKKVEVFDSEELLAVQLAKYTAELSDKFAKERGAFTVVLSGGSLIKALRKLCEAPYVDSVEWGKWHVFWVDERVVPKDHEDSNYKLAYDGFLSKVPFPTGNVYAINDALSAEGAADDYETCLKHLVMKGVLATSKSSGFPKFDLMLLGMGPDGHVASLFPGHPLVNEKEKWVTFIKDSPKPPPERITFTFPVINSSAYIAMVVNGAGKSGAVQTALGNGEKSDTLPVQLVSPEDELTWFLDKEAASKL